MTLYSFPCALSLCALAITLVSCRPAPAPSAAADPSKGAQAPLDPVAILASARADIEAANEAWLPGLRNRDAGSITAAYEDEGLFIAPDGAVTRGRAAITNMYAARFPSMREILGGDVVQEGMAVGAPDLIYEWGHAWVEMAPEKEGGATAKRGGKYLTAWHRGADGHWRITRNLAF